jgi:hypothetical protein
MGEEDYIGYIARSALAVGAGKSGSVGEAPAYLFGVQKLVEHAVRWIEQTYQ